MRTLAPLGHVSRVLFDELIQTEELRCWFCRDGYYEIYLTESGLASAKEETRMISRYGFHPEVISGDALREREPATNDSVLGGVFYPEAATINPYQFVMEMAQRAEQHGATFQTATGVVALRTADGRIRGAQLQSGELIEADSVVLAGGAYSVPLLHALGIRFPLQAAKGYTAIVSRKRARHHFSVTPACWERIWCFALRWMSLCASPALSNCRV